MSEDQHSQEITRVGWLIRVDQYEQVIQILAHLLAGYLDNASITYKVTAFAHNSVSRFEDARAATYKALVVQSNDPDAHRFLAEALIARDHDPETEPSSRTAPWLVPEDDALLSLMSIALTRIGYAQEALFYAHEAARLSPGSVDNHMTLTMAQMETDPQAVETTLQETLTLDPMFGDVLLLQSWVLDECENRHDATKVFVAYMTQTSDHERSRLMADVFLMKLTSSACLELWGTAILILLFLSLVRSMNLSGNLLPLPLVLATIPMYRSANSRIRTSWRTSTNRSGRILHSFTRTHRFLSLWSVAATILWLGLTLGTTCAIRGADVILFGVARASLGHLTLGWVVLRIIPFIQGRNI